MSRNAGWTVLAAIAVIVVLFVQNGMAAAPAANMGKETCAQCHESQGKDTVHARLNKATRGLDRLECESCHGNGEAHVTGAGQKDLITRKPKSELVKSLCLTCHPINKTESAHWKRDVHFGQAEMDCLSCHDIHSNKNPSMLKTASKNDLCISCHQEAKAEFNRPFHHPIGEGQLECAECHDPHRTENKIARAGGKNDICLKCHSEVRGPFMWEHKATTDDAGCLNCHQPHGGTSRKLLKQTDNQLCLGCHQSDLALSARISNPIRSTAASIEHSRLPALQNRCATCHGAPFSPIAGPTHSTKVSNTECRLCHADIKGIDHTRYLSEGRCVDCHTDIHGSNHNRAFLDFQ